LTEQEIRASERVSYGSWQGRWLLKAADMSAADERLATENLLLLTKLQHTTLPIYAKLRHATRPESAHMAAEVDNELERFNRRMIARWTPRTACRKGYVVSMCSETLR
jgi:hypothetical protein